MNPTCEKCGARCCKTLIQNVDGFAAGPLELIMTRAVARVGNAVWINAPCNHLVDGKCSIYADRPAACSRYPVHGAACQATREHVP